MTTWPGGDVDIARTAALIGDPARARVLTALLDGRALAASALAAEAGVAASTASQHLSRLREAELVKVEQHGRARYYRLASSDVADALEALARISPTEPINSLRQGTRAYALRQARTCYHHLAGRVGVALMAALLDRRVIVGGDGQFDADAVRRDRLSGPGHDVAYELTPTGRRRLTEFGLDVAAIERHRPAVRYCLDWSEQRHHLAGPFGSALTTRFFDLDWLRRRSHGRAVTVTPAGRKGLATEFGVELEAG